MNYKDSIIGTATELNVLRENRVLHYHQSATVYPGRGQNAGIRGTAWSWTGERQELPNSTDGTLVEDSAMLYGDLRSKLAEGNAKECPSLQEKPLERTLVVVAKAQVLGWTLAEICATKYRFVNKPWRKTVQQNVGHWLNPSWWDLYSRGPVSDWWDLHVQPWTGFWLNPDWWELCSRGPFSNWILTDEDCAAVVRFLTEPWAVDRSLTESWLRTVQLWTGYRPIPETYTAVDQSLTEPWAVDRSLTESRWELYSRGLVSDWTLRTVQRSTVLCLNREESSTCICD